MTADVILTGPGEGRAFGTHLGETRVKVESGAGDFSVLESTVEPGVPRPPLHVHHRYDEAWFVIEGTVEFFLGTQREVRGAGSLVFVPRGVAHSFANPCPQPSRILVIGSSPVPALVEEVGGLLRSGPPDPAVIAEAFGRCDSEVVVP